MRIVIAIILAYILGSIPFGYLVSRIRFGRDVRSSGSGATGATNVARQFGVGWAILVMILDIAKGIVAVLLANLFLLDVDWLVGVVGIVAILGHVYPVWIGFRGGKGVNTALGVATVISPIGIVFGLIAFGAAFAISKFVSVGSIAATITYAIAVLAFGEKFGATGTGQFIFAIALPLIVIWTHRDNLKRLLQGKELKPTKI